MNRRLFLHLWLAIFFLLTQQGAFAHAISHIQEDLSHSPHQSKRLPHNDLCPQCAAFGHMGNAVTPALFIIPGCDAVFSRLPDHFTPAAGAILHFYFSRAPPALVKGVIA